MVWCCASRWVGDVPRDDASGGGHRGLTAGRPNVPCGETFTCGGASSGPLGLADRLHRGLALLGVEPVDEDDAVEVVGLVLDAAGQPLRCPRW